MQPLHNNQNITPHAKFTHCDSLLYNFVLPLIDNPALPRHSLWPGRPSIMITFRLFLSTIIELSIVENSSMITAHYRTTFRLSQLTSVTTIHHWRK